MSADRETILATATGLISGDRAATYGSAEDNFARVGRIWGAMLGVPDIEPAIVAAMLAGLKLARIVPSPAHADNWVDGAGYMALGGEIACR